MNNWFRFYSVTHNSLLNLYYTWANYRAKKLYDHFNTIKFSKKILYKFSQGLIFCLSHLFIVFFFFNSFQKDIKFYVLITSIFSLFLHEKEIKIKNIYYKILKNIIIYFVINISFSCWKNDCLHSFLIDISCTTANYVLASA